MSIGKVLKVLFENASIGENKIFKAYQQGDGEAVFTVQDDLRIVKCDGKHLVIRGLEIVEEDVDGDAQKQKILENRKESARKEAELQRMARDKCLSSHDGGSGYGLDL